MAKEITCRRIIEVDPLACPRCGEEMRHAMANATPLHFMAMSQCCGEKTQAIVGHYGRPRLDNTLAHMLPRPDN